MSGICGIVSLKGQFPRAEQLLAMTSILQRRGPDGTHHWIRAEVALGHTLLATTPEALIEVLPFTAAGSACTITADVRLDNRFELITEMGLSEAADPIGDGELILRAYEFWGDSCVDHLLGDFAFAIWDANKNRLFCARDHLGMRQLTYQHMAEEIFIFSTDPRAIHADRGIPGRVNEQRIANFLDDLEGEELTSTFFEDISRLPPAHCLILDATGLTIRRYWRLVAGQELELADDAAYAKAFLDVFSLAVECRLRSARPVGSMLSGGMDSGAIVAVASQILARKCGEPLRTFSAMNTDFESCVESRTIRLTSALPDLTPHFITLAGIEPYLDDLIGLTEANDEPSDGYMTLVRAVYLAGHRAGINVMLDGAAGDVVLTEGNYVARLLRSGHLLRAIHEARCAGHFWGQVWPGQRIFLAGIWQAFAPWWLRYIRFQIGWWRRSRSQNGESKLTADFALRTNSKARMRASELRKLRFRHKLRKLSYPEERAQIIQHPYLTDGRERYDRVAAALALEPRDPFLDIRVIEFCLSLPLPQLQSDGWLKIIVRRATAGILPDEVRWRRGKEHLGLLFTQTLFSLWPNWVSQIFPIHSPLSSYVKHDLKREPHSERPGASRLAPSFKLFYLYGWLSFKSRSRGD